MARVAMTVNQKAETDKEAEDMWTSLSSTSKKGHEACEKLLGGILPSAVRAGLALAEAKQRLDPSRWRRWLNVNGIPIRRAELYIALATDHPQVAQGATRFRDTDVRHLLAELAWRAIE